MNENDCENLPWESLHPSPTTLKRFGELEINLTDVQTDENLHLSPELQTTLSSITLLSQNSCRKRALPEEPWKIEKISIRKKKGLPKKKKKLKQKKYVFPKVNQTLSASAKYILETTQLEERNKHETLLNNIRQKYPDIIKRFQLVRKCGFGPETKQILTQCYLGSPVNIQVLKSCFINCREIRKKLQCYDVLTNAVAEITSTGYLRILGKNQIEDCLCLSQEFSDRIKREHNRWLENANASQSKNYQPISNFSSFRVTNISAQVNMKNEIELGRLFKDFHSEITDEKQRLRHDIRDYADYDPELLPYLAYHYHVSRYIAGVKSDKDKEYIKISIYASGIISFFGAKTPEEINEAFIYFISLIEKYLKPRYLSLPAVMSPIPTATTTTESDPFALEDITKFFPFPIEDELDLSAPSLLQDGWNDEWNL